jgi:hypothetical protein
VVDAQRTTETSWTLFFDTNAIAFPMGGHFLEQSYQEWNANGQVDDCGSPGFGFNGGNWAQDFCIDNVWIEESSIDPDTPLPACRWTKLRCDIGRAAQLSAPVTSKASVSIRIAPIQDATTRQPMRIHPASTRVRRGSRHPPPAPWQGSPRRTGPDA